MKEINVGLIGFGLAGRVLHMPFLQSHPGFCITDVYSSQVDLIQKEIPGCRVHQSLDSLLSESSLGLVINCGPNETHFSYAKEVLKANKHLVIEKPFVNTVEEGLALIELARSKNKVLTVFHNRRWDGDFLTVKDLVASRKLGDIKLFEARWDRFRPDSDLAKWREKPAPGAGVLFDLGPHLIDQVLQLFGLPKRVFADIDSLRDSNAADDYFHLILDYGSKKVVLRAFTFAEGTPRFEICGSQGVFRKFGVDIQESQLREKMSPLDAEFGVDPESSWGELITFKDSGSNVSKMETHHGNYMEFYNGLYQSITEGKEGIPVPAKEALEVIQIIELAFQSHQQGTWVDFVPLDFK
ncbi:MAG: oxidoreductase [Bdellovibrionaceae bacterium]|nr:oxidoreductase [Pseudobdellovibrionaceae bacterium]